MLQQKLIIDRYINLNLTVPPIPAHNPGDFVTVNVHNCYLQEATGVFKKTSGVQAGVGPKAHRNFRWLPWIPGAISETPLGGVDVLTGPMSGCWLVHYRRGGQTYAGHLGTDIARPDLTRAVNNAWNGFARANRGDVVGGFNPIRHWQGAFPVKKRDEPHIPPKLFGLYTTANQYYIMVGFQQRNPATKFRIAGLQLRATSPLTRLQQVHLPGP